MAKLRPMQFLRSQRQATPPVPAVDLSGKTVIVVGANTGLGYEATLHLAKLGASRIILACRNLKKSQSALEAVRAVAKYGSTVELWKLDLGNFASVLEFADRFEKDGGRLDILLANAGISTNIYEATGDGWESTLQVNHLATSLVSFLLTPSLVETAKKYGTTPRLVVVSSEVHYWATLDKPALESKNILQTLSSKEYCTPSIMSTRYFVSKLMNVFFVCGFNKRLPSTTPLITATVNPGYCYSSIRSALSWPMCMFDSWMEKALARTTEAGSRQLVWAAVGVPKAGESTLRGAYVSDMKTNEVADFVLSDVGVKTEDRIWDETVQILSKLTPNV